jgi:hypothetical protein
MESRSRWTVRAGAPASWNASQRDAPVCTRVRHAGSSLDGRRARGRAGSRARDWTASADGDRGRCNGRDAGFDGYIDDVADSLQVTRPQRRPKPSSATSWTPEIGLEICAGMAEHRFARQNDVAGAVLLRTDRHRGARADRASRAGGGVTANESVGAASRSITGQSAPPT